MSICPSVCLLVCPSVLDYSSVCLIVIFLYNLYRLSSYQVFIFSPSTSSFSMLFPSLSCFHSFLSYPYPLLSSFLDPSVPPLSTLLSLSSSLSPSLPCPFLPLSFFPLSFPLSLLASLPLSSFAHPSVPPLSILLSLFLRCPSLPPSLVLPYPPSLSPSFPLSILTSLSLLSPPRTEAQQPRRDCGEDCHRWVQDEERVHRKPGQRQHLCIKRGRA
jgi:hypothetical protein